MRNNLENYKRVLSCPHYSPPLFTSPPRRNQSIIHPWSFTFPTLTTVFLTRTQYLEPSTLPYGSSLSLWLYGNATSEADGMVSPRRGRFCWSRPVGRWWWSSWGRSTSSRRGWACSPAAAPTCSSRLSSSPFLCSMLCLWPQMAVLLSPELSPSLSSSLTFR